jgi:hypothetical protein
MVNSDEMRMTAMGWQGEYIAEKTREGRTVNRSSLMDPGRTMACRLCMMQQAADIR